MIDSATQYVGDLTVGDGVSLFVRAIDRLLSGWGVPATIAVARWQTELRGLAKPYRDVTAGGDAHLNIYHFSASCAPLTSHFRAQPGRHMVVYHNVTPPIWFVGYDEHTLWTTGLARTELCSLRAEVDVAVAFSTYNVDELRTLGFPRVKMIPFVLDFSRFDVTPAADVLRSLRESGDVNLLFVGRVSPNKCQEDVVRAFFRYHRAIQPKSRLFLVGSTSIRPYADRLRELIVGLGLEDRVHLIGHVSEAELAAYYRGSHVFVCMSEHEGFCVPLLEAMYYELPVLAYSAAAVPETMGDAGILVTEKRFDAIAEMIHQLVTDERLRAHVVARQKERLGAFDEAAAARGFLKVLEKI